MTTNIVRCPTLNELPVPAPGKVGWPWTEESQQLPVMMPDGSAWPKISVVTPSYNQGQFIEETIRSVLLQGYPNLEFIIIDGGSNDNSLEIIRKYEAWLTYWVSEMDRGQGHAINKGIRKATGDILFWLNSDDISLPDVFCRVARVFKNNPNVDLVVGQAHIIDGQGKIVGELRSYFTSWQELVTNPRNSIRQISTFFLLKLFNELGFVDESLNIAMDTELLVRFTQYHTPLILNDYLTAYRSHAGAKTFHQLIKGYEESDRTRGKYLSDRSLALVYNQRSSDNWLSLSELDTFTFKKRIICLFRSFQKYPPGILSRRFWSSVKGLGLGLYRAVIDGKKGLLS